MIHDLLIIALGFLAGGFCGVVVGAVIANADDSPTPRLKTALSATAKENPTPTPTLQHAISAAKEDPTPSVN